MFRRALIVLIAATFFSASLTYAGARNDAVIEKGDECGSYGGQNVYITNNGDRPIKATIKVIQHHHLNRHPVIEYRKEVVDPGESLHLGCDIFGQGNGIPGTIEYYITGAYYVE
jgi:hypothetical protein